MKIEVIENSRVLQCWPISIGTLENNILNIVIDCKNTIENILGNKLYSTYLYWWHAQNNSTSIYSDLDIMLFFLDEIDNNTKKDIVNTEKNLTNCYKDYFSYVWLEVVTPDLYEIQQPLVYWLLTRNLWIHIWWNNVNHLLPLATLDKELWAQLNDDYYERISNKYLEFLESNDDFTKKLACRWIMKKLLRTSFGLIIDKVDFFENDTKWLVDILSIRFPKNKEILKYIGDLVNNPSWEKIILDNILKNYLPWLKREWSLIYN